MAFMGGEAYHECLALFVVFETSDDDSSLKTGLHEKTLEYQQLDPVKLKEIKNISASGFD